MRRSWLAALPLLTAMTCAPRRPAPPAAAPAAPRLSAETKKEADQEYYQAVSAYMDEDYARSRSHLQRILSLDPAHPDALALLRRIKAAQKVSTP